ncbi:MAG: hypothetical protein II891_04420 [Bacteroidales bacterium]|nr:hypothetical protein [Bacteroidales bacterium]
MKGLLIDLLGAMLALSGAGSPEELSEYEAERFARFAEHPLELNLASRSRLLSSGLFSAYQVAALEEYRQRSGDILSLTELALVDGIGPSFAEALGFFVSFGSSKPPGARERRRVRQSLLLRGAARFRGIPGHNGWSEGDTAFSVGVKYHLELGERAEFFWSSRTTYSSAELTPGTFSLALYSRRGPRLILGDYAARFGQGLALWSSFSMTGFGSVAAFRRNASGFAPTSSFSPALRGAAFDLPFGRWTAGGGIALDGGPSPMASVVPIAFASYFGRRGQLGVQVLHKDGTVVSVDGTLGLGHWTLFGETALSSVLTSEDGFQIRSSRVAAVGGASWAPVYRVRFTALARYYPSGFHSPYSGPVRSSSKVSDETGFALGAQWRKAEMTFDAAVHPQKATAQYKGIFSVAPEFSFGGSAVTTSLRCTERFRPKDRNPWRHEARLDLKFVRGPFSAACRGDLVLCKVFGALGYAELGYQQSRVPPSAYSGTVLAFSAFVRASVFRADAWDDRIYCYERDLPGAFSVPAYYGQGWTLSAMANYKYGRHKISLKSSFLSRNYKSAQETVEIKLQYQVLL